MRAQGDAEEAQARLAGGRVVKALSLIPKKLDHGVAMAFGRILPPILSVRLEKGEERLAKDVALELMSHGMRGKIVTVHTEAQVEAAERRMAAERNSGLAIPAQ